jgi:hypothetical protein
MASKGGKIPPVVVVGVAGAGVLAYLWWRSRQAQGSTVGSGTATQPAFPAPVTPLAAGTSVTPAQQVTAPVQTGQPVPVTSPMTSGAGGGSTGATSSSSGTARAVRKAVHAVTRTGKKLLGPAALTPGTLPAHSPYAGTPPAISGGTYPAGAGIVPPVTAPRGTPYTGGPWSIFTNGGGPLAAVAWAQQLLHTVKAPVTRGNLQVLYQWQKSEGGGGVYNPLNQGPVPGQPGLTTSGVQYGGGAANFASWKAGIQGAAAYLHMPNFSAILGALKGNNPAAAKSAIIASPWAASHYGGGANWYNGPLPALPHHAVPATAPVRPPGAVQAPAVNKQGVTTNAGFTFPIVRPAPTKPRNPFKGGTALQRLLRPASRPKPRGIRTVVSPAAARFGPAPVPVRAAPVRRAPVRYYSPPLRRAVPAYHPPRGSKGRFVR